MSYAMMLYSIYRVNYNIIHMIPQLEAYNFSLGMHEQTTIEKKDSIHCCF